MERKRLDELGLPFFIFPLLPSNRSLRENRYFSFDTTTAVAAHVEFDPRGCTKEDLYYAKISLKMDSCQDNLTIRSILFYPLSCSMIIC